ncbi:MAG: cation-translocating P-type ATPase [Atopobiaceae bacterium]|nr:cation-translocating P-type ATPase [Atopobiaceae bacterium]
MVDELEHMQLSEGETSHSESKTCAADGCTCGDNRGYDHTVACDHNHSHDDCCGHDHDDNHSHDHTHEAASCSCCGDDDDDDDCNGDCEACACYDEHDGCTCGHDHDHAPDRRERTLILSSGAFLLLGLIAEFLIKNETLSFGLYVISAVLGIIFIAPAAFSSLKRKTADMNVLMGIAVVGALALGFMGDQESFRDGAIVIFLAQIGEWLEGWSMRKSKGSIRQLMKLAPEQAHLIGDDNTTSDVALRHVNPGQRVRILPGERVPLDGTLIVGTSAFDESPITGESLPVDKAQGDKLFAGSMNVSGVVDMEVTARLEKSSLSRIVEQVQGAQATKAPYESFVNRFAALYTPIVVVAALIAALVFPLINGAISGFSPDLWPLWFKRAISLLVVACPCALVISTPVTFVSAISRAARLGILVKGGAHFDVGSKIRAIAFDKTGTLSEGKPQVVQVYPFNGASTHDVLSIAATLEEGSTHPLARALVEYALEQSVVLAPAEAIEETTACGMSARIGGIVCRVGKPDWARTEAASCTEADAAIEKLGQLGASSLVVVADGVIVGVIGLSDALREGSSELLGRLSEQGITRLMMLTGDNAHAAQALAAQAGITEVHAELLPEDKLSFIESMAAGGERVAMVGDGINDAPALAAADLAVTMGAAASDTALELADVSLLSNDMSRLPDFFALAKRTMIVVRENIVFTIGVKLLVFVLVLMGHAGMGAAVFADTGVALIVILNGMKMMLPSISELLRRSRQK